VRYAINIPNFGIYSDIQNMAELAHEAEEAGWDGFFIWDHIGGGPEWDVPLADPLVMLTAIAMRTRRIKLGPIVTALPRVHPWKLARETASLDRLSRGRLILGVGIGSDEGREYSTFNASPENKLHGEMLDEGLTVLTKLWSGESFDYAGQHYTLHNARFLPTPLQQPRIHIWVAGVWPHKKPFRRAAQWDGVCPLGSNGELTPANFQEIVACIKLYRQTDAPFDVLAAGHTKGTDEDNAQLLPLAEAGVTWWQEAFDWNFSLEQVRARIRQGPPTL